MSLEQLNDKDRILFLREFVLHLIIASVRDEEIKKAIEIEKIKRKYLEEKKEKIEIPKVIFEPHEPFLRSSYSITDEIPRTITPRKKLIYPVRREYTKEKPREIFKQNLKVQPTNSDQQSFPQYQNQEGDGVMKLDTLIKDPAVQIIECPGAGKNILVRVRNKANVTRIILTEAEINSIIDYFSKTAKIPMVGGILKAAVGNLLISAVVSEYVGSRFIINKKSPYELIEGFVG